MDEALSSSVWVTSPEFAGWLLKRGFHWRKLWKKRWIALHGAEIVYMEKEPTVENSSGNTNQYHHHLTLLILLLDIIMSKALITSNTIIEDTDIDNHEFGFAIHINDGTMPTWYLRADSLREKKRYIYILLLLL
jgi:hypothetical protein